MRRVLFWMHLSAGVLISLLVIFFSVTGALLAYERQIVRAADERSYGVNAAGPQTRLSLDTLLAPAIARLPAPVEMWGSPALVYRRRLVLQSSSALAPAHDR